MKTIGILGEGAWGTALANLCADNGFTVYLWCHNPAVKEAIEYDHSNPLYLPGVVVHQAVIPTQSLEDIFTHCRWVIETTPVQYLRSVLERCVPYVTPHHTWVIASKGIERDTLLFPSQIIDAVFKASQQTMVLAGPSFAKDLAAKVITGLSIAAATCQEGIVLQSMLANAYCRPFVHTDLIGAQVGGAIKNVIALGIGMLQGAGYSDNTRALLLTYGLHESVELAIVLGGRAETMYGFSGVGDIVLTSMCSQSRNHQVGYALGKGKKLEDILRETGYTPEGVNSAKSIYQLMHKVNLALPICRGVYEVVYENRSIADMLAVIMDAPLECE